MRGSVGEINKSFATFPGQCAENQRDLPPTHPLHIRGQSIPAFEPVWSALCSRVGVGQQAWTGNSVPTLFCVVGGCQEGAASPTDILLKKRARSRNELVDAELSGAFEMATDGWSREALLILGPWAGELRLAGGRTVIQPDTGLAFDFRVKLPSELHWPAGWKNGVMWTAEEGGLPLSHGDLAIPSCFFHLFFWLSRLSVILKLIPRRRVWRWVSPSQAFEQKRT
jgi:hypothetical protein